jgi:RNA polymerase-binding transcription factor DksA
MATSADILGSSRPRRIPARWSDYYARLCREKDRLLARDCSSPEGASVKVDDLTEAGSDESLRDMAMLVSSATQQAISEIAEALRRIEVGTYGICEITGEPIEQERLEAIPWVRCSFRGQAELEKEGQDFRVRMPGLSPVISEETPAEDGEDANSSEDAAD